MMKKTKALAMILTGVFLLSFLPVLQAQSEPVEQPTVRATTTRASTTSSPVERPTTTRMLSRRTVPTPTRPTRTTMYSIRSQGDLIASGLLKVVCDESILGLDDQILGVIVNSSFILSAEAQEALTINVGSLGRTRDQNLFALEIFEKPALENEGEFGVEKGVEGEKGEGEDFLERSPAEMISEIAVQLENILMEEYEKQQRQMKRKLDEALNELEPLEEQMSRLNARERELYAKAGMSSLRRNDVLKQIQSLERMKQEMEMRLVEKAAREEALQEQIAILGKQTEIKLKQDSVLEELELIMKLREEEMERVKKMMGAGQASQKDYFRAREALAQARIKLVERKEEISDSIRAGTTLRLRVKELADITISNTEDGAVLRHIEKQLSILKDKEILELADQFEVEIALKQDSVLQSYDYARENIQEYKLLLQRMVEPSVSVLGER